MEDPGPGPSSDPEPIPDTFFAGLTYHIASSFPPGRAEELDAALSTYGATRAESVRDEKLNLVVADSAVWEGWEVVEKREREAREKASVADGTGDGAQGAQEPRPRLVEVVTDKWVDRGLLTGKLQRCVQRLVRCYTCQLTSSSVLSTSQRTPRTSSPASSPAAPAFLPLISRSSPLA